MQIVCYYTCNLVPPGFLERAGVEPRSLLGCSAESGNGAGPGTHSGAGASSGPGPGAKPTILPHPNTCPYVVRTLAAAETVLGANNNALLAIPSGCDAMRRAGDALKARFDARIFPFSVPRVNDAGSVAALTRDLDRLRAWLDTAVAAADSSAAADAPPTAGRPSGRAADAPATGPQVDITTGAREPAATAQGTFAYARPPRPGGVFVLGGPMSGPALLAAVAEFGIPISGVETCRGPECGALLSELSGPGLSTRDIATRLLQTPSCPRFSTSGRRAYLRKRLQDSGATSVLYARLPFCDPGAYDADEAQTLANEHGLPFLELEVGYPLEIDGRLRVRIEAFLETLTLAEAPLGDEDDLLGDDLLGDDLFEDDLSGEPSFEYPPTAIVTEGPAGAGVSNPPPSSLEPARGNGSNGSNGSSGPLSNPWTRRAVAARTKVLAIRTGTAHARLEHSALSAGLEMYKPGAFVPWVSYLFPPEIMTSYGLTPFIPEVVAATLSGSDFRDQLEAAMNRLPISRDICSYHRATKAALAAHLVPPPSVCLGTTPLCLGKECMLDTTASEFDVPFRSVRVPLPPDEGPTPLDDIADVAEQLRVIHDYLGTLTGRTPDLERAAALIQSSVRGVEHD